MLESNDSLGDPKTRYALAEALAHWPGLVERLLKWTASKKKGRIQICVEWIELSSHHWSDSVGIFRSPMTMRNKK